MQVLLNKSVSSWSVRSHQINTSPVGHQKGKL